MPRPLASLLFAGSLLAIPGPGEAQVGSPVDPVTEAETALAAQGYDPGPPNSVWGETSTSALRAYQRDWGLPETGELSDDLLARLRREHPATRPQWFTTENGCQVWNQSPQPRESVAWTGACPDGRAEGEGVLVWRSVQHGAAQEQRHEGMFRDGRANGYGVVQYAQGGRYEGEFRDGARHGQGTRIWPGGSRYEGQWRDGRAEGQGTLHLSDGRAVSGTWSDGCFRDGADRFAVGTTQAACGF